MEGLRACPQWLCTSHESLSPQGKARQGEGPPGSTGGLWSRCIGPESGTEGPARCGEGRRAAAQFQGNRDQTEDWLECLEVRERGKDRGEGERGKKSGEGKVG